MDSEALDRLDGIANEINTPGSVKPEVGAAVQHAYDTLNWKNQSHAFFINVIACLLSGSPKPSSKKGK